MRVSPESVKRNYLTSREVHQRERDAMARLDRPGISLEDV